MDCGTLAPKAQKRQPPMAGSWRNITHRHDCGWWNGTIVLALGRSGLRQQTGFFLMRYPNKKITVTSTNGNCDQMARRIAQASYRFFYNSTGKCKNRHDRTKSLE